jgi:GMP synthase (glutamine-hydrolysing)
MRSTGRRPDQAPALSPEPRLKARLWVQAALRQCGAQGIMAVVARHGDDDSGAVLVKLNRGPEGCEVFTQVRDGAGRAGWLRGTGAEPVAEPVADAYIARQRDIDSDLWVVEIEDRQGRLPFLDHILAG